MENPFWPIFVGWREFHMIATTWTSVLHVVLITFSHFLNFKKKILVGAYLVINVLTLNTHFI